MKNFLIKNKKRILKFLLYFIIGLIIFESIEFLIHEFLGIDLHNLRWGWIGLLIVYGFKYHIFCCLFPALWAGYKCKQEKCKKCEKNGQYTG